MKTKRRVAYWLSTLAVLAGVGLIAAQAGSQDPGTDPTAIVNLPDQPVGYFSQPDHEPAPSEWMHMSELVVAGEVEDFSIYRARDEAEVPGPIKAHKDVQAGLHFARWRVKVVDTLKGTGPAVVNVISGDYAPIKSNKNHNPWIEGRQYRFYLAQNFLKGNFYFVNFAEAADSPVPTPDPGPVKFDDEGDSE